MRHLTLSTGGVAVPKQFCSLGRGPSLLSATLQRARIVAPRARIVITVAEAHRRWWRNLLKNHPADNLFVETRPRGTGIAILHPLLEILRRDPRACIAILPSDHYVDDEPVIAAGLRKAMRLARSFPREVLLLGFETGEHDPDLGYIVPREGPAEPARRVQSFVEKPGPDAVAALAKRGALLNSFIVVATGRALLQLFERRFPRAVHRLRKFVAGPPHADGHRRLARLFEQLPEIDFSFDLVGPDAARLRVVRIADCGWCDLGTPARLQRVLHRHGRKIAGIPAAPARRRGALDLAERVSLQD
jgi:mannose-1-phosphate guanylyltransferase